MKALADGGTISRPQASRPHSLVLDWVVREAPLILAFACSAAVLFSHLSMQFAADSWLNLLGGREIAAYGLPHHDTLAVLSRGNSWIDQQWLAHLFYYGAYAVGGLDAAARANVVVFLLAVAGAFLFARRRGAAALSVALCSIPMLIVGVEFLRAQILAELLFVALLALLASESRVSSQRVFLALPILVVWANVHGSVLVAAALVATLGFTELVSLLRKEGRSLRGAVRPLALIALPWACVVASPYGTSVLPYFNSTLRNPDFPRYLTEWASPTLRSFWGVILLLSIGLTIGLVARRPRALTAFEVAALALTMLGAAMAVRSIVWFTIAVAMLLPPLLALEQAFLLTRSQRAVVALAAGIAVATVGLALARPGEPVSTDWPPGAVQAVKRVVEADPGARVLAGYDVADWLLFKAPGVRGRIAFDGRWEILSRDEFLRAMRYLGQVPPDWQRFADGYRLVVLNPTSASGLVHWYERQHGVKVLYQGPRAVVFDRAPRGSRSS